MTDLESRITESLARQADATTVGAPRLAAAHSNRLPARAARWLAPAVAGVVAVGAIGVWVALHRSTGQIIVTSPTAVSGSPVADGALTASFPIVPGAGPGDARIIPTGRQPDWTMPAGVIYEDGSIGELVWIDGWFDTPPVEFVPDSNIALVPGLPSMEWSRMGGHGLLVFHEPSGQYIGISGTDGGDWKYAAEFDYSIFKSHTIPTDLMRQQVDATGQSVGSPGPVGMTGHPFRQLSAPRRPGPTTVVVTVGAVTVTVEPVDVEVVLAQRTRDFEWDATPAGGRVATPTRTKNSTGPNPDGSTFVAFSLGAGRTVVIRASQDMPFDSLLTFADDLTFTDEQTWRNLYHL